MRKLVLFLSGIIMIAALAGCGAIGQTEEPWGSLQSTQAPVNTTYKTLAIQTHLCIEDNSKDIVITSQSDFDEFSAMYNDIGDSDDFKSTFSLYKGYFLDNVLVVHVVLASSGSDTYEIVGVDASNMKAPRILVKNTTPEDGVGTCDMATWFFFAEIPYSN